MDQPALEIEHCQYTPADIDHERVRGAKQVGMPSCKIEPLLDQRWGTGPPGGLTHHLEVGRDHRVRAVAPSAKALFRSRMQIGTATGGLARYPWTGGLLCLHAAW